MPPRRPRTGDRPAPVAGSRKIATGTAALVPDDDGRRGWTLLVNGVPSSHLDLDDPLRLDFEYMRWAADLLDTAAPDQDPLHTVHLGGAGCSLARYLAASRPTSRQVVIEIDPDVITLARQAFGLRSGPFLRFRADDARAGLTGLAAGRYDVVIRDAFAVDQVPEHLTTGQFLDEVRRVLGPRGIYLANVADDPGLARARAETATARDRFREVVVIAEPAQLKGRRHGNVILAASDAPLPVVPLGRRLASGAVRATLLEGEAARRFAAGRRPLTDGQHAVPVALSEPPSVALPWSRPWAGSPFPPAGAADGSSA